MSIPVSKNEVKITFIGTSSEYSLACLDAIRQDGFSVVAAIDSYRHKKKYSIWDKMMMKKSQLHSYGVENGFPVEVTDDMNSKRIEDFIRKSGTNLICVASACQLLKENIIKIPSHGVMNAHGALLPNYRGANPPYWIFLNHEHEGGVTLHYIDIGEDTGDIITQEKFDIPLGMTRTKYHEAEKKAAVAAYRKALKMLVDGTIERKPQGESSHPRARNVSGQDFLLSYEDMHVEDAYHFLMGTDGIGKIYKGWLYSYEILDYQKGNSVAIGKYDIRCKDGVVRVGRKIDPVRAAKNLVKGVLMAC